MKNSEKIISSWQSNANAWVATIDGNEIENRQLATNNAFVECINRFAPKNIIDIGCGEGWLCRVLANEGIDAVGFDAVPKLIERARELGGATYSVATYRELANMKDLSKNAYNAVVINFALIDKEDTEMLVAAIPKMLKRNGRLFIQTLHSFNLGADEKYVSGWKEGSWTGMKQTFVAPYQWYYRTVGDWVSLITNAGFSIEEINEPLHPVTKKPLSLLFVLKSTQAIS
ncbi:MAG: class I SAM-dependent methyltransferase [Bacteroidota bacterium]